MKFNFVLCVVSKSVAGRLVLNKILPIFDLDENKIKWCVILPLTVNESHTVGIFDQNYSVLIGLILSCIRCFIDNFTCIILFFFSC